MGWLSEVAKGLQPVHTNVNVERKTLVLYQKVSLFDLEVCHPKVLVREQSFWRTDRVDIYHLLSDNSIKHTPG